MTKTVLVIQSCPALCDPMSCCPPGSSVHGVLQEGILKWVVIPFSRASSQLRDWTCVSCIAGGVFTVWATDMGGLTPVSRVRHDLVTKPPMWQKCLQWFSLPFVWALSSTEVLAIQLLGIFPASVLVLIQALIHLHWLATNKWLTRICISPGIHTVLGQYLLCFGYPEVNQNEWLDIRVCLRCTRITLHLWINLWENVVRCLGWWTREGRGGCGVLKHADTTVNSLEERT